MALQKTFELENGSSGNYIRVGNVTWDRLIREASCSLILHLSAARAGANPFAYLAVIARIRLTEADFDTYMSNEALDDEAVAGNIIGQFYIVAKTGTGVVAGAGFTEVDLSDATDV